MRKLEDTVVIMFHGGSYGKYLYWVLNNFTTYGQQDDKESKLDNTGSSHQQRINGVANDPFIADQRHWQQYIDNKQYLPFYARHYIEGADTLTLNPKDEIDNVAQTVNKVILIQNTPDNNLQCLDDGFEKTFKNPVDYFNRVNRFNDFKIDVLDLSAVREMLSYKLFYLDYKLPVKHNHPNVLDVQLNNLLHNFENTLHKIVQFLGLTLTVTGQELLQYHFKMLSLQKHINKDKYIARYLDCFDKDIPCSLPKNCTIIDEAYIQHYLRDQLNLELRCDGLEVFPNTASKLKDLTYPAEEMVRG